MGCTAVFGIAGMYYFITASFPIGYRFPIPVWFYPFTLLILIFSACMFGAGIKKEGGRNTKPIMAYRILIFLITLAFSVIAISTPHKINKQLDARENNNKPGACTLSPAPFAQSDT
jgi:hypothetical protein